MVPNKKFAVLFIFMMTTKPVIKETIILKKSLVHSCLTDVNSTKLKIADFNSESEGAKRCLTADFNSESDGAKRCLTADFNSESEGAKRCLTADFNSESEGAKPVIRRFGMRPIYFTHRYLECIVIHLTTSL